MRQQDRRTALLAEKKFLHERLHAIPGTAKLTRTSLESRLQAVEEELAQAPMMARSPSRARLTFDGRPVVGSHGVFADFGAKAVARFSDAVAAVAASITAPLAAMGPIPGRGQNQLLITNTALGSFGFELEEYDSGELALHEQTTVEQALELTQRLLQDSADADDEALADAAAELDQRALDKVRDFVVTLADNDAVCGLQVGQHQFRFTDPGQVRRSLERLSADNLREHEETLEGTFQGVLPLGRTFEFRVGDQVLRGKIGPAVTDPRQINDHLNRQARVRLHVTQVGSGRPRYTLVGAPQWEDAPPLPE